MARKKTNMIDAAKSMVPAKDKSTLTTEDVQHVLERRGNAMSDMLLWKQLLTQAHRWATPNANAWYNLYLPIVPPARNLGAPVADLTLVIAHRRLLAKMLTGMIPKGQQWMRFVPGDKFQEGSEAYVKAQSAADLLTEKFFNLLDKSRFYLAASEALSDCLISTGFMTINEGTREDPFKFCSVSDALAMVEGDAMGGICGIFRDWKLVTIAQIPHIWGEARMPAGSEMKDKVNLHECSFVDWEADEQERYVYAVLTEQGEVLYVARDASWPWVYFRMSVLPGENRGRGPSLECAPTAATINKAIQDEMVAAAFQANPMYMSSSDSAWNPDTFIARPGSIIPVQMVQGEWPISVFPQAGNPTFTTMVANELRQQINEMMFTEPLGPINGPDKTATESNIRYRENLETFAASIPRLQNEFFDRVIKRCIFIMHRVMPEFFAGLDQEVIRDLIDLNGNIVGLRYETPLMTARGEVKRDKLLGYMQAASLIIGPEGAAASLNAVEIPEWLRESYGLETKLFKTKEELQTMLDAAVDNGGGQPQPGEVAA